MKAPIQFAPEEFYDRQWEQHHYQQQLLQGRNILMTAPRRVGKTFLMHKLLDWARAQQWVPVYADVQDATSEADFFEGLTSALVEAGIKPALLHQAKNIYSELRKHLPGKATLSDGENSLELDLQSGVLDALHVAQTKFDQLLAVLAEDARTILIGLDEMPIFLAKLASEEQSEVRVASMLNWFRKVRTAPALRHIRWLLCGSIGLDTLVEQRQLAGSINDLVPEKLGPFELPIAIEFVKHLGAIGLPSLQIDDTLAASVVARVGWPLPYYLRLLVDELRAIPPSQRSIAYPSEQDIETAYHSLVSAAKTVHFAHWQSRLELQFGKVRSASAHTILKLCCQRPTGTTRGRLLTALIKRSPNADSEVIERELVSMLTVLERDGYLHGEGSLWAFRSFVLRDYWLRHVIL